MRDLAKNHEIPIQSGVSFQLLKGETLTVVDPKGRQVSDLFCFNLHDFGEAFSAGRTIDYNDTIYITRGASLYSNRSSKMLEILEDSCGRHDLLMTPCSLKMFQIVAGNSDHHPSCHENLSRAFSAHGISGDQIGTTFNIFMNVSVAHDGRIKIEPPRSRAGDLIQLKAHMDLLVGLTACSHEETNDFNLTEIEWRISSVDENLQR